MADDALDYLLSAGAPSVSFADRSTFQKWIVGDIISMEKTQQTDFQTKAPKFYDDEKQRPMWQLVFTLQTDERDPNVEDDDGVRRLFAKGQMVGAIKSAVKQAGHSGDVRGGKLGVAWVGEEQSKSGLAPSKIYKAKFAAPSETDVIASESPSATGAVGSGAPTAAAGDGAGASVPAPPGDLSDWDDSPF